MPTRHGIFVHTLNQVADAALLFIMGACVLMFAVICLSLLLPVMLLFYFFRFVIRCSTALLESLTHGDANELDKHRPP